MKGPILAKDIMVTNLVTLTPDMDVFEAIGLLLKYRISGAPVIDANRNLVGIFSENSCMQIIVEGAYDQLPSTKVDAFTIKSPKTIAEETDLLTIAQIFLTKGYRRLPVLRDGKLVGQVSRRDVMRAAHDMMRIAPNQDSAILYLSSIHERQNAPIA